MAIGRWETKSQPFWTYPAHSKEAAKNLHFFSAPAQNIDPSKGRVAESTISFS